MLSVEFILPKPDASENYEWQKKKKQIGKKQWKTIRVLKDTDNNSQTFNKMKFLCDKTCTECRHQAKQ